MYGVFRYVLWVDNIVYMNSITVMTIIMGWVMYKTHKYVYIIIVSAFIRNQQANKW